MALSRSRVFGLYATSAAALVLFGACGGSDATGPGLVATSIQANSAQQQNATAGSAVASAPSVIVRDQDNNPMGGVTVTFGVTGGGGTVSGGTQTTNASGIATVGSWTLGTTVGVNTLTATATGLSSSPVTFTATGVAGAAANIAINAGNNQSAPAGTAVAAAPSVKVTDANGNAVAGVTVTFAVGTGGGSVTGATPQTDASGIATVGSWTLGAGLGAKTLTASATGLSGSPVTFTATATAGAAAAIALNAGDGQTAVAGAAVGAAPSVKVTDSNGNPVAGVTVTFAAASGGGSVTGATPQTDASGIATVGSWTLGTTAGANTLTATVAGLTGSPVTFTATGVAGPAAVIAINGGDGQTAVAGTAVAIPPSVKVTDANGNPVAGVTVTFAVGSGGGIITGATPQTDASGVAAVFSWTLGVTAGTKTMTATVAGLTGSPVTFTATAIAGAAANIAINSGNNQTAPAGTQVPVPPSVKVTDANGNAVSGVSVTFAIGNGGGSVAGPSQTTNASGIAAVGSWTLGPTPGVNTLTATSAGLTGSPVTFTATATTACSTSGIAVGGTVNGTLSNSDCQLQSGEFVKFYTFTIATQQAVTILLSSTQVDPYVLLLKSTGDLVAENDDRGLFGTDLNSELSAILAPGNYIIAATTIEPDFGEPPQTGSFTLSLQTRTSANTDCIEMFISRSVTTTQTLSASDCEGYADLFVVHLQSGETVNAEMLSADMDAYLALLDVNGFVLVENDNKPSGGTNAEVSFTATEAGYYYFVTTSATPQQTGTYILNVD